MADPVLHPADDLNPCATCAGHRTLTQRSWSDPQYWVICDGCGALVGGDTLEGATLAWNALNAPREVAPEDVLAHDARLLQTQLTGPVLVAMQKALALWHASGQAGSAADFVRWATELALEEILQS